MKKIINTIFLILFIGVMIVINKIDNPTIIQILEIVGIIILAVCALRTIIYSVKNNKWLLIPAVILSACSLAYSILTFINPDFWAEKSGLAFILRITGYPLIAWGSYSDYYE